MGLFSSKEKNCAICADSIGISGCATLKCGHHYHKKCIEQMSNYKPGDFILERKHICPLCKKDIKLDRRNQYHKKISTPNGSLKKVYCDLSNPGENKKTYYRFCTKCKMPFNAGDMACGDDMDSMVDKCETCRSGMGILGDRVRECPKCGYTIQWSSGCSRVTCTKCKVQFCFVHNKTEEDIKKMIQEIKNNPNSYTNGAKLTQTLLNNAYISSWVYKCPECLINKIAAHSHDSCSLQQIQDMCVYKVVKR